MSLADDLRAVKAVIDTPEKWVKEYMATDVIGLPVQPKRLEAVCWCAIGAIDRAFHAAPRALDIRDALVQSLPHPFLSVPLFNDDPDTTHDDVMALFDRAIERAEA